MNNTQVATIVSVAEGLQRIAESISRASAGVPPDFAKLLTLYAREVGKGVAILRRIADQ
jgi:hypothetical protein